MNKSCSNSVGEQQLQTANDCKCKLNQGEPMLLADHALWRLATLTCLVPANPATRKALINERGRWFFNLSINLELEISRAESK